MSRRNHKRDQVLEIHVRFESNRVTSECLASPYEQIVPLVRRTTEATGSQTSVKSEPTEQQVGGMHG